MSNPDQNTSQKRKPCHQDPTFPQDKQYIDAEITKFPETFHRWRRTSMNFTGKNK